MNTPKEELKQCPECLSFYKYCEHRCQKLIYSVVEEYNLLGISDDGWNLMGIVMAVSFIIILIAIIISIKFI